MTKADQVIKDNNLSNKQKYNAILKMWAEGIKYAEQNELTNGQYERFAELPIYLSGLLELIEPVPHKRKVDEVFGGFKI